MTPLCCSKSHVSSNGSHERDCCLFPTTMVWPLTLTRAVSFKKIIHASPDTVLKLLHDPNVLFTGNPLITDVISDPSNPSAYTVTDRLVVLGYFKTQVKYKCRLSFLEDGVDTDVVAGLGTKSKGQYRVRDGENGTTVLSEDATIEGLCFLISYIVKTMSAAHEDVLENLGAKAENRSNRQMKDFTNLKSSGHPTISFIVVILTALIVRYLYPASFGIPLYMLFVGMVSVIYWFKAASDPYGLFHLALNKLPGDDDNVPPKTEWLNMGFWQNTDVFPQACAALAMKLTQAAQCKTGDRILGIFSTPDCAAQLDKGVSMIDVGHGTGESVMLLLSEPSMPRPSSITGITSLPAHHRRTQERVDRLLSSQTDPLPDVWLHLGDAVCQSERATPDHPLAPSAKTTFDRILALDCAYHFDTRRTFLQQSLRKLAPGGRIALADICFDPDIVLRSRKAWLMSSLLRLMPKENMVSSEGYKTQMVDMGYVDVQVEDITKDVFPGFVRFLKGRGMGWRMFGWVIEWYGGMGAQFIVVSGMNVRGYEERSSPKPHTVYRIEIHAHVRSWQMWRRYSEFDQLHTQLTKSVGAPPPVSLPPKHSFSLIRSHTHSNILDQRRGGLENYLRAIIGAKEDKWRESFAFKDFLGVPISRQGGGPPTHFTSATWLDEHIELQTRIRAIRADINKRDALSDRGDVGASHKANVTAKAKLPGLSARISTLEKGLNELGMSGISEGELQRRSDMVARLRDDHEKLTRMVTAARQTSRPTPGQSSYANAAPESDREALLSTSNLKPVTRVFGAKQVPQETEQTRPLDDHGILGLQQVQMQQQDEQLSQLTTILQRQKQLGMAIGNEIGSQIELLDDLSNEVDRVGGKLTTTNRQLNRLG
ncbi:hypothetical protein D9615_005348 [Tricholomella constricta]|uniref:Uncharacterized protein n=1 Tax=Tricholomella constricta TaxID=117010 RepID=A0A8H5M1T7_9AGAR|nr:hypothetical protein D9615_005348 [Tricholomella constricta]